MSETTAQFWAGFVEGVIHIRNVDSGFGGWGNSFTKQPALFTSEKNARREYEDVRRVWIVEEEPK